MRSRTSLFLNDDHHDHRHDHRDDHRDGDYDGDDYDGDDDYRHPTSYQDYSNVYLDVSHFGRPLFEFNTIHAIAARINKIQIINFKPNSTPIINLYNSKRNFFGNFYAFLLRNHRAID